MKSTKIKFLFEFPKFKRRVKNIHDIIFFFPFYHFGGGERVHADILKIFKDYKTTCFLVHRSDNDFMKDDFMRYSDIFELHEFKSLKYSIYYKTLAKEINGKKNPIVFGCNNLFFYRLLPYLESHVKIIDLTHAFTYEDPYSPEKFSLNVVDRISKRIVLGMKTYNDYKALYKKEGLDEKLIDRIHIVRNKVDAPKEYIPKKKNERIKIIFVGRNSYEKRPEIFFEIAKRCYERNIPADFLLVGDFSEDISHFDNMKILGSIKDRELLNSYYLQSDLLFITSFREGFPMVVLEGMAMGVVPVCTNVGEIHEFVGEKFSNGIIIQDKSIKRYITEKHTYVENQKWIPQNLFKEVPEDVVECIETFINIIEKLEKDKNRLAQMSENSYKTVIANFSLERKKKAYLQIFFDNN